MKRKSLFHECTGNYLFFTVFLSACFFVSISLPAQVTIGGLTDPATGTLLDLNSTVKGGLQLSNVEIRDLFTIPDTIPAPEGGWDDKTKKAFTGSLVYHIGGNGIPVGVCFWNGERWIATAECTLPNVSPAETAPPLPLFEKTVGESVAFSVSASGSGISYQWWKKTKDATAPVRLPGETNDTLTLNNLAASADTITYYCIVTGACGAAQSADFLITVCAPVTVSPALGSDVAVNKSEGESVDFVVTSTDTGSSFQWYKNSSPISGATNDTLTLSNLVSADAATYYSLVSNKCSTVQSGNFILSLTNPGGMKLGVGNLTGKTCFDIGETDGGSTGCGLLAARRSARTDFAASASHTYTFTATTNTVTNVRFQLTEGMEYVASTSNTNPVPGRLANDSSTTFTITFKNNLNAALKGRVRDNAAVVMLYAIYNNNTEDVSIPYRITIQDCQCCGAFVAPNVWKSIMCHNLGADYTADPFVPSYRTNGAYYKWGSKTPAVENPTTTDGTDPWYGPWNPTLPSGYYGNNVNGDQNVTVKSEYDPCPDGYRIMSQNEWDYLNRNNPMTAIGTWTLEIRCLNCWVGVKFGDALMLPAPGFRFSPDGMLHYRGRSGCYWSNLRDRVDYAGMLSLEYNGYFIDHKITGFVPRGQGMSVRCIAE
jgi:hypothetical protein